MATNNYNADPSGRTCSHYAATVPDSASLKVLFHQGVDLQVSCEGSGYSSVLVLSISDFSTPSPNPLNFNYSRPPIPLISGLTKKRRYSGIGGIWWARAAEKMYFYQYKTVRAICSVPQTRAAN